MKINNLILIIILSILSNCAAVGYMGTNDFQTIVLQGRDLERSNRMAAAHERYKTALKMAEESGDARKIAWVKYYLGLYYRDRPAPDKLHEELDKSIKYLKESLYFYTQNTMPITTDFSPDIYTALTEVYDKKGDNNSACGYLKKLNYTYLNKIITHPKYAPNGTNYKNFYNATGKKFSTLAELIEYYNQKIGCGI